MKHTSLKKNFAKAAFAIIISTIFIACDKNENYQDPASVFTIVKGAGDISPLLTQFRALLGEPANTTPNQVSGRREVNWDGVPANLTNNNNFPFDFFNATDPGAPNGRKRGLVMNSGDNFRVDSTNFAGVYFLYANQFKAFTPKRTFANMTSTVSTVFFKVPGTNIDAYVQGFGVVFSDIDDGNSTSLEFFSGNKSLGVFKAPNRADADGFSFLGVFFPEEKVTSVKIIAGNRLLGVAELGMDVVVMDDFLYNEPKQLN